jgi:general secretion pathway protein G
VQVQSSTREHAVFAATASGTRFALVVSMNLPNPRTFRAQQRARRGRGFSLLEIVVVVAIIAMISAGITVAVTKHAADAKRRLSITNAVAIRQAVKAWWLENDASQCPTVKLLVADGSLDRRKNVELDAWMEPWKIECSSQDATVMSKGPDRKAQTEDDISVPET